MGEAVGLDLGAATAAAACLRGDEIGPAVVVPTADLGVGATTSRHRLESLAARAVGAGTLPAAGVAIPTLNPVDQDEVQVAAREAFANPLLVLRPAAAAAWFRHTHEVHPDAVVVVVEADETEIAVTMVRPRPRIPSIAGQPVGWLLTSGTPVEDAVDAVAATLNAADLVPTDIDVALIVGGAAWLARLAEGITGATDLAAVVDPQPRAAVAYGAALLAAQSDGFGVGTALALGTPAVGASLAAAVPSAAPPLGSGFGEAVGATGGPGTGLGAAMRNLGEGKDAPTDPIGSGVGEAVGETKARPTRPKSRLPAGALKRRLVLVAPAMVAVLAVGGLTVRSCTQNPDTTNLATSSEPADPDDPSTTGTTGTDSASPGGSDKPDPLDPTTSEPRTSSTSTTRPTTTTPRTAPTTPGTPPPSTPVAPPTNPPPPGDTTPPSVTGLVRSVGDIYADNGECDLPMTTVLSATITDDTGVTAATVSWSAKGGFGGQLTMARAQGNTWSVTLGPIPNDALTTADTLPVTWSVVAVDAAGNKADSGPAGGRGAVNFHGCRIVIG